MSFTEVLTTLDVLLALIFFAIAGVAEPFIEHRLNRMLEGNHPFRWSWDHLLAPFARAVVIVTFVFLAYPSVFGVRHAPELGQLLGEESLRVNNLLGVVFVCTFLLPVIPPFSRRTELIMPIQGLIATAAVFSWYTDYLGATAATAWPGFAPALLIVGLILLGDRLASDIGQRCGYGIDKAFNTSGFDRVVPNAVELLAQAPVMLCYGMALGQQIAI